jgi:hypothetical protein
MNMITARQFCLVKHMEMSPGLENLAPCSALNAFEQGGIFIVPHLL